jgi:DNA-binding IclR family transcriptional regulator
MSDKLTNTNKSLEKAFRIIEIMASAKQKVRISDLAKDVDLPISTALRFVNTLVKLGFAYQEKDTLCYSLSLKLAQIADQINSKIDVREVAHPYLVGLSRDTRESACLAIEENMEVVYIDSVDGPANMLKITQRIGKRAPMHSTGIGKLLLLNYSEEKLETLLAEKGLDAFTRYTITTLPLLKEELMVTKSRGYALDNMECEAGATCIAAPVYRYDGIVIAGISVSTPASRMTSENFDRIKPLVLDAAAAISQHFGYSRNTGDAE